MLFRSSFGVTKGYRQIVPPVATSGGAGAVEAPVTVEGSLTTVATSGGAGAVEASVTVVGSSTTTQVLPGSRLRIYRGAGNRMTLTDMLQAAAFLLGSVVPTEGREIQYVPGGDFPADRWAQTLVSYFYNVGGLPFQLEWLPPLTSSQTPLYFTASPRPA